jgi:integrase
VRWKDIDLDSGELAIVQTITNVDGKLTVGSPKTTKRRRVIYLDGTTVTMLHQHRLRQREDQIAIGAVCRERYAGSRARVIGSGVNGTSGPVRLCIRVPMSTLAEGSAGAPHSISVVRWR